MSEVDSLEELLYPDLSDQRLAATLSGRMAEKVSCIKGAATNQQKQSSPAVPSTHMENSILFYDASCQGVCVFALCRRSG